MRPDGLEQLLTERAALDEEIQIVIDALTRRANTLFGENLKRLREERHMTQALLAMRIGLTRTSVTNMEAGRQAPPWQTLCLLADAFNVSLDEFRRDD